MIIELNVHEFEIMFSAEKEEFYLYFQEVRMSLASEIEFLSTLENNIKIEFIGSVESEQIVLGKEVYLGPYGKEYEEVKAFCIADLSRFKVENGKLYFNTEILFEDDL